HTRFSRDWSSDVCSSDLPVHQPGKSSDEDCKAQMGMPENPPYRYRRGGVDVVIHDFCSVRFPLRTGIARCGPPDAVQASLTVGVRTAKIGRASCRGGV